MEISGEFPVPIGGIVFSGGLQRLSDIALREAYVNDFEIRPF